MILLEISNASELVASKVGKFLELLTPDQIDQGAVEDQVIKKMVESLSLEGLKGEISLVNGIDVKSNKLIINEGLKVRSKITF